MNFATMSFVALIVLFLLVAVGIVRFIVKMSSDDPTKWEREIRRFETEDRYRPPSPNAVVFTGSSSIRFWKTLGADMAPLPALNRGFGGAQIYEVTYYMDRIVLRYRPRAVVFYAGENDVAGVLFSRKKSAEQVRDAYRRFHGKVHEALPRAPVYFISIKPPKRRRKHWPEMERANRLIREDCTSDPRLRYIDVVPAMLDSAGNVRGDLFKWDGIHLNVKGYATWTAVVKPILMRELAGSEV